MARWDIKDQAAHDAAERALSAFHAGGGSLPASPHLSLAERITALEREIVEAAVNSDRPSNLAVRLIGLRAEAGTL